MTEAIPTERALERHTLQQTVQLLRLRTGLTATIEAEQLLIAPSQRIDALLRIPIGKLEHPFFVEVKNLVTSPKQILAHIHSLPVRGRWLVLANQISKAAATALRDAGVGYVDMIGNISIPLHIQMGGMTPNPEPKPEPPSRPRFRPSINTDSMILTLFHFLARPETLDLTQRELADLTGVSAAAVNRAIASLQERGFLAQKADGRKILRKKQELIQRWVTSYGDAFRPGLYRGRFRQLTKIGAEGDFLVKQSLLDQDLVAWGGEPAAERYTRHLKPERFTLYFRGDIEEILNELRLSPSPDGNIELLEAFWPDSYDSKHLAPPLVVYADLIGSGIERNRETARILSEQFHFAD